MLVRNISGVLMIPASFYYSGVTLLDCGAEEAMDLMRRLFDLAGSPSLLILFKESLDSVATLFLKVSATNILLSKFFSYLLKRIRS